MSLCLDFILNFQYSFYNLLAVSPNHPDSGYSVTIVFIPALLLFHMLSSSIMCRKDHSTLFSPSEP